MNKFRIALVLLLAVFARVAVADVPDGEYVGIYNIIQRADALKEGGEAAQALAKFAEAQNALIRFHATYPDWNLKIVNYRLKYLEEQISALSFQSRKPNSATVPAHAETGAAKPLSATPGAEDSLAKQFAVQKQQWENQMGSLQDQVTRLQADKVLMEAKLKEAFSAQPAPASSEELRRALARVAELEKRNELLQASLEQSKNRPAGDVATAKLQKELAAANARVAELTQSNTILMMDRQALQTRLDAIPAMNSAVNPLIAENELLKRQLEEMRKTPVPVNSPKSEMARKLQESEARYAVLKSEKDVLRQEKMALEATLNQLLISQKTGSQVAPADVKAPEFPETSAKLQVAQAKIETLQKDKETLRMEKAALEQHIKNNLVPKPQQPMLATSTAPLAPMENVDSFYATKIATLESQRDSLEKSLEAASKDIAGRKKGKLMSAHVEEMGRELAGLKARIEVLESHPVSYTSEELDMLSAPPVTMMSASHVNGAKAPPSHSANVKGLLAEGHRLFVDHQRDAAQQKFREALTLEPGSYEILSELASVQLDMGQLDEAEKNLKLALKAEPDDYYSLYVLGQVKFLQKKYDDALTVLSRAAQITPQDANVENVIGMTLSEKGLRSQAETAFRNAVRLDPNFAEAHYNLAVEYVTQKPPLVALARFHYQKATSLGHEKSSKLESMIDAASR